VGAQRGGASGQEKAGAAVFVGQQDHRDGGRTTTVRGDRLPLESHEILPNPRSERVVESAGEA
jgi:hypothetical protein